MRNRNSNDTLLHQSIVVEHLDGVVSASACSHRVHTSSAAAITAAYLLQDTHPLASTPYSCCLVFDYLPSIGAKRVNVRYVVFSQEKGGSELG